VWLGHAKRSTHELILIDDKICGSTVSRGWETDREHCRATIPATQLAQHRGKVSVGG
jgi:hypothetical protein